MLCDGGPCAAEDVRAERPPAGGPNCFPSYSTAMQVLADEGGEVVKLSTGQNATCALLRSGELYCWGDANYTGVAATEPVRAPTKVLGLGAVVDVDVATSHTCAVIADGSVFCWGFGAHGELGSSMRMSATPVQVPAVSDAISVRTGDSGSCAILRDRTVRCWGPVDASGASAMLRDVVEMSVGGGHTCAVLGDGSLRCLSITAEDAPGTIGRASAGQFAPIAALTDVRRVVVLEGATCALRRSGEVLCWGQNRNGDLGTSECDRDRTISTPTPVYGIADATAICGHAASMCAVRADFTVHCWGTGALLHQAGYSIPWASGVPVRVPSVQSAVDCDVFGGFYARTERGGVFAWGVAGGAWNGLDPAVVERVRVP